MDDLPPFLRTHQVRNRVDLTPGTYLIEVCQAAKITAKSMWHLRLVHQTVVVGWSSNTTKWSKPVLLVEVSVLPNSYPYASAYLERGDFANAARFMTALAKEFYP
jgi:hypothetical protein